MKRILSDFAALSLSRAVALHVNRRNREGIVTQESDRIRILQLDPKRVVREVGVYPKGFRSIIFSAISFHPACNTSVGPNECHKSRFRPRTASAAPERQTTRVAPGLSPCLARVLIHDEIGVDNLAARLHLEAGLVVLAGCG